jgi:hypothetical protein
MVWLVVFRISGVWSNPMKRRLDGLLFLSSTLLSVGMISGVVAQEVQQDLRDDRSSMTQVTSVSQLSDVRPTDWAFQALQSLVERYGCIVGYPDRTYRGNRALTRYEFAAGLNACLDKIQELIAAATADFVKKEDLEIVKKLQEEFSAELATLRGRVETLEVRVATLEKQQFSTTTKLSGEVIFDISNSLTGEGDAFSNNLGSPIRRRDIPNLSTLATNVTNGAQAARQTFTPATLSATIGTAAPALTPTQLAQAITSAGASLQTNPGFLPAGSNLTPLANVLGANLGLPPSVILQGFSNAGINVNSITPEQRLLLANFHVAFALSLLGADNAKPVLVNTKPVDDQLTFGNVVFLNLNTSFTGKDLLKTRFVSSNIPFYTDRTGALESAIDWNEDSTGNALQLKELYYSFSIGQAKVFVGVKDLFAEDIVSTTVNLQDDRVGLFFRNNPLSYRYAGGAGVGFNYPLSAQFNFATAFLSDQQTVANPDRGITRGGNTVFGQLTFTPNSKLTAALTYNHAYTPKYLGLEATLLPTLFLAREEAIIQDAVALNVSYALSPKLNISGWVGYEWADSKSSSAEFERFTWAINLGFPDLLRKGNYGGISVGFFPYVTQEQGRFLEKQDPPLLAQAFYGFRVNDYITVQPSVFIIANPTGDSEKETILIGSVRVKFVF